MIKYLGKSRSTENIFGGTCSSVKILKGYIAHGVVLWGPRAEVFTR